MVNEERSMTCMDLLAKRSRVSVLHFHTFSVRFMSGELLIATFMKSGEKLKQKSYVAQIDVLCVTHQKLG